MRVVGAAEIDRLLDYPGLIEAIREAFAGTIIAPARHHHRITRPGAEATLLLMPAWHEAANGYAGVKIVSVFPDNAARSKPSVTGTYLLLAGDSGEPLAALDGVALTLWRTAATSALASRYLSRTESSRLAMIGAGALAPRLVAAHASVRPIAEVTVWSRTAENARRLAATLKRPGLSVTASEDLAATVAGADIVSAATLAHEPLIRGAWLKPGTHVDLVGAYTPRMREADDDTIRRARVFVDTRAGMKESGDIAEPLRTGNNADTDIAGDLHDMVRGLADGRRSAAEITLFKSVGNAIEDLAAAVQVWKRLNG
ncbi:MAG: ornithine cyclodeaminase family protein [Bauldia sp.]|nr:ornithine cyclodeaminase family protein [Bauldia sp.]